MQLNSRWGRITRSQAFNGYAMLSPTALYAILLLAAPLVTILAYSFFKDGYLEIVREFTFENYIEAWSDPLYQLLMVRSVGVSMLVTFMTVLLAFPIAYFVSFYVSPERKWI